MTKNEENKSKRKQLLLYPSLHDDLELLRQILIDEKGQMVYKSFNDLIDYLGSEFVGKHKNKLEAYKKFLKQMQEDD